MTRTSQNSQRSLKALPLICVSLLGMLGSGCDELRQSVRGATEALASTEFSPVPTPTTEPEITRHFFWYDGNETMVSGLGWTGKSAFVMFLSKTGPESEINAIGSDSSSTGSFTVEKIVRLWWADELGRWSVRETTCPQFPCQDDSGTYFSSPLKGEMHLAVGDTFVTSYSNLSSNGLSPVDTETADYFKRYDFGFWGN
ncbi:MAG: hypothetical protein ACAI44_37130 [Candidatus Sericytochromatia bacterium]